MFLNIFQALPSSTVTSQNEKENNELKSSQASSSEQNLSSPSSSSTIGIMPFSSNQNSSTFVEFEQDEEKAGPNPVLGLEVTAELLELQVST